MSYQQPPPVFYKNPGLAAVLSFFWMGLGQIYNGQISKGIAFIVAYAVSWLLWAVVIGMILTPLLWIYGIYDAYKSAQKKNVELQEMYMRSAGPQQPPPRPDPTLREHPKPAPPAEPEPPTKPTPPESESGDQTEKK